MRLVLASLLFGLMVAGGTVAVGLWNLSRQMDERAGMEMQGRRELLTHIMATIPSVAAVGASKDRFNHLFFGHADLHLALVEQGSTRVLAAFSDTATESVTMLSHAKAPPDTLHAWVALGGTRFSGWHGRVKVADGHEVEFYLSIDRSMDIALLAGFIKATLLTLPLLLAMVAVGAGLIARTGLAPVRKFKRLAASIGTKSLDQRVSPADLPSELADMATEFNGMLDRIDEGYRQLEEFSGDLAHEMRTPVATLLGRTQVALSRIRSAAELREVMEGNVEELERLSKLIGDMLFIAHADHDGSPIQAEAVDLVLEAQRVVDYLSLVADDKGVQIRVQGQAPPIPADRLLVQRAITNLVSNAIRHAFANSTVSIEIHSTGAETTLAVTNEGEGIAPALLDRVFDRFFRADPGRSREAGGSGLGLAIVRSIAAAHRGRASVRSEPGRTTFTLTFPSEARDGIGPQGPQTTAM
ncbi:MAG: heavy metal sensor histidine kinase [Rubrivivax sp.]|nr:heavy metal sensor histidine kinase [Rubrivivax sp.]